MEALTVMAGMLLSLPLALAVLVDTPAPNLAVASAAPPASIAAAGATGTGAQSCSVAQQARDHPGVRTVRMGDAWSGVRVRYPALERNGKYYFGYYDANRQLTIAEYAAAQNKLCLNRIASRFGGWDSHNSIFMAFDPQGYLHVAANMHASPMVYARGPRPDSAQGIALAPMVGSDEARVTYPRFQTDDNGQLMFIYRSGGSGNGTWIANRLDNGRWKRLNDGGLFAARDRQGPVSAYPTNPVQDVDGRFHMAIVWRRSPDTATNFRVSYISTTDFQTWRLASGKAVRGPITADNADLVDDVGVDNGLGTSASLSLDGRGAPVIAYTKYDETGANAAYVARPTAQGWRIERVASGKTRVAVQGRGTRQRADVTSIASLDPATGTMRVTFPRSKAQTVRFAAPSGAMRQAQGAAEPPVRVAGILTPPRGLLRPTLRKVAVIDADSGKPTTGVVQYFAQDSNRDVAPACDAKAPLACKPPASPVYLVLPN
ncbi:BNR repeat-containing protein [Sphingobium sp. WCS2017Hpa-17]|uniref:BNR repeat-containing protein n=1 Tax=Sphingobium sp. WCS2017Hpa-17 TaxID=3073638 RepID=UPI00288C5827|nr:BNR repeat-containing protein [Sphingobium sp. WCS2017Hpa-17]